MTGIEDEFIIGRIEYFMQGNCKLYNSKIGGEVTTSDGDDIDDTL